LQAVCKRDTNAPYNHDRALRGKTCPRFTESGYGNRELEVKLSSSQAQDIMQAGSLGIQRDGQHQPQSLQSCQLTTPVPFFFQSSSSFQSRHKGGVEPLCQHL
jgi:hypothetical protein